MQMLNLINNNILGVKFLKIANQRNQELDRALVVVYNKIALWTYNKNYSLNNIHLI